MQADERARINYVDVILGFATFVSFAVVAPWLETAIGMLRTQADPLTSVLVGLVLPLLIISLLYSLGVSARS